MRAPSSDFPLGSASSFGPESAPQLRQGGRETRRPAKEVAASAVGERRRRAVHPPPRPGSSPSSSAQGLGRRRDPERRPPTM